MNSRFNPTIGLLALIVGTAFAPNAVHAEPRDHYDNHHGYVMDHRYDHNHYYPPHGYSVHALPPGYHPVYYHGASYYFHGGIWYRPYGPRFVVVAPPIGVVLPVLPAFYTTVWFGGIPYYYANDAYYVWRDESHGYVVSDPPPDVQPDSRPAANNIGNDVFIYPKNGQSEEQQASDRYECHRWAVDQAGFDPTQPTGGVPSAENANRRSDYQRAQAACLEGRGYTVK